MCCLPGQGPNREGGKPDLPPQSLLWGKEVGAANQSLESGTEREGQGVVGGRVEGEPTYSAQIKENLTSEG